MKYNCRYCGKEGEAETVNKKVCFDCRARRQREYERAKYRRGESKSSYRNKADKLCSELARSKGKCEICGETNFHKLQWSHGISRSCVSLRYDSRNYLCLCASCHTKLDDNFALKMEWWKELRGKEAVKWIRGFVPAKSLSVEWWQETIKNLEKELSK